MVLTGGALASTALVATFKGRAEERSELLARVAFCI